jgi:hypothetical protein
MFDILHFGLHEDINTCMIILTSCVYGRYMWMERLVSIDIDSIVHISSIPSQG